MTCITAPRINRAPRWLALAGDTLHSSEALACDNRIPVAGRLQLRGQVYDGQALRGLGGGGIGQNLTTAGRPPEDRGGWAQVNLRLSPAFLLGVGCGIADPDDAGLPATGRLRNTASRHMRRSALPALS